MVEYYPHFSERQIYWFKRLSKLRQYVYFILSGWVFYLRYDIWKPLTDFLNSPPVLTCCNFLPVVFLNRRLDNVTPLLSKVPWLSIVHGIKYLMASNPFLLPAHMISCFHNFFWPSIYVLTLCSWSTILI